MPLGDWQFWVVSLICLAAAYSVIRPLLPKRRKRERRVKLTIKGSDQATRRSGE